MKKILFVAEQIASFNSLYPLYIKLNKKYKCIFSCFGPSLKKTKEKNLTNYTFEDVKEKNFDLIIRGASDGFHENNISKYFQKKNIKVISIFDSWCNYTKRYIFKNEYIFPNTIIFQDKRAKKEFERELNKINLNKPNLIILGNPTFERFNLEQYKPVEEKNLNKKILILSDYNNTHNLLKILLKLNYTFELKPHPRDKERTFSEYKIKIVKEIKNYQQYNLIVSTSTFFLIELKYLGCRVVSISTNGKKSFLKFEDYNIPELLELKEIKKQIEYYYTLKKHPKPQKIFKKNAVSKIISYINSYYLN